MYLLDIVFPKRCVGCGKVGKYFCPRCIASIRYISQNETICPMCEKPALDGATHPRCGSRYCLDGLTSFFHYRGTVQKAVKTLKYRFVFDLAKEFIGIIPDGLLAYQCHPSEGWGPWLGVSIRTDSGLRRNDNIIMIPIPLHSSRLHFRGFNQAEELGKFLVQRFDVLMRTDLMKRVAKTESQVEVKDREKRLNNLKNAFETVKDISGSSILLFDDVWTTGATMRSAGNVLKRAGALRVWAITMAR